MSPDPTPSPRAVLFDFGGVITTSPFEAFARHEAEHGLPEGVIRSINATNPDHNAWAQLERNRVDIDQFVVLFEAEAAALGHDVDARAVLECLSGDLRPQMVRVLRHLADRPDVQLALLTNNFISAGGGDARPGVSEVLDLFDVIVESSTAGCRKPDLRFYELALDQLQIAPHEAVFLDDLGINLKPARAMGMTTIKVTDPASALDELGAVLGFELP